MFSYGSFSSTAYSSGGTNEATFVIVTSPATSGFAGGIAIEADANQIVNAVLASSYAGSINAQAESVHTLSPAQALQILQGNVQVLAEAIQTLASNSSTATVKPVIIQADANVLTGNLPTSSIYVYSLDVEADSNTVISAVNLVSSLSDIETKTVNNVDLSDIYATLYIDELDIDTVRFDYEALKDQYDKGRTLFLVGLNGPSVLVVNTEGEAPVVNRSYTIMVGPKPANTTIYLTKYDTSTVAV